MGVFDFRLHRDHKLGLPHIITAASRESIGVELAAISASYGSSAWPAANQAILVPFTLRAPIVATKLFFHVGAAAGTNCDIGLYSSAFARLVSAGATAVGSTNLIQVVDITNLSMGAGQYYLALVADNTTTQVNRWAPGAGAPATFGVLGQTTAYPLPATITPGSAPLNYIPFIGLTISPRTDTG